MTNRRATGLPFELEVFAFLEREVRAGSLGIDASSPVYHRRPYYSRARQKNIIFDVAVELFVKGASEPSLIWIWECKDYKSPVAVKAVEEFHAKLEQIGADATKGTLATRGTFQESAIKYAISQRMGLVRFLPEQQVEWLVYRPTTYKRMSAVMETDAALTDPTFCAVNQSMFGFTGAGRTKAGLSLNSFLRLSLEEWDVVK